MSKSNYLLRRLLFWVSWIFLFVYFRRSKRTRVLITSPEGKIFVVQGAWMRLFGDSGLCLPGGAIEKGESPIEGARRELSEELAIDIDSGALKFLEERNVREYGITYRGFFYQLTTSESIPMKFQTTEIVAGMWLTRDQLKRSALKPEVQIAVAQWL